MALKNKNFLIGLKYIFNKILKAFSICIVLIISIHTNIVSAQSFFSNTLDVYSCNSEETARNCSKCKLGKNVTLQLNVNIDKSIVIFNIFEAKKNVEGGALEQCKVVDKKNWQCGNGGSYSELNTFTQNTQGMVNGIYYSIYKYQSRGIPKTNIGPMNLEIFSCAK